MRRENVAFEQLAEFSVFKMLLEHEGVCHGTTGYRKISLLALARDWGLAKKDEA